MATERTRYEAAATLSPQRAFAVHFTGGSRRRRRFAGRVEHLASGSFTHFASLRGLLAFFAQRLDAPGDP
jgi:hypothetical protein